MRITTFVRLCWSIGEIAFYGTVVMAPVGDLWFIDYPAKLAFAWWFVSAIHRSQEAYRKWREEKLHKRISPITAEPAEVYLK